MGHQAAIMECESPVPRITELLVEWSAGDGKALDALMPLVYDELRRLARSYLRRERQGHTMQSTSLVHEAFLRLVDQRVSWQSRSHFFGIAAQVMRRILVDHARGRQAAKRGAGARKVVMADDIALVPGPELDLVALDEALRRLEALEPQRGRLVELKFFGGLSMEETAQILGISVATVQRQWAGAKAWLHHEMTRKHGNVDAVSAD